MGDAAVDTEQRHRSKTTGLFAFSDSAELLRADLKRVGQPFTFRTGELLDFHALRRTFATMLNKAGVAESDIGVLLGHGAKSVARGHYLGEQLEQNAALVAKLPMPEVVQLRGRVIRVGGGGEVVAIKKAATSASEKKRRGRSGR